MEPTYTLDDIARTTDEMAVRRRFDRRNRFWLLLFLFGFAFVVLINVVAMQRRNTVFDVLLGVANLAVIASVIFVVRDSYRENPSPAGRWLCNHVSAALITYVLLQYASLLTLNRSTNWVAWTTTFPFFLLAVRMPVAELVLVFALLTGSAALMPIIGENPFRNDTAAFYISTGACNAVALVAVLFASYRMRRQVRREWNERRTQAREQIRMRDELRYARELQLSMLPECAPQIGWADLCAISIPATEVGGDYYDYFVDADDDRISLVCGDVAGHGMSSGLVLAALRSGFTLLRDELHDPAAVLRRLHDLVAQTSRRRMLVTVTVVLLDHATMEATIASAGHPPVLLRRADGTVETINLFAPPLGVRLPVSIPQRRIAIASGDTFVLHSDGIYETLSPDGETYGLDRLATVVGNHDGAAESLRDAIIADVDAFRGSAVPADDVTVVVAKVV